MPDWKTPSEQLSEFFTLDRLGKTWRQVKREFKAITVRDCIDYRDWAQDIGVALKQLRDDLVSGDYYPEKPGRFEMPKSKGAFRLITMLGVRDAIVYRAISDAALDIAFESKKNVKGAYFSRRHASTPIGDGFSNIDGDSVKFFEIWMRYNEYRSKTLLARPYSFLVVADIANFFDSIHHELLMEHLAPLGIPRPVVSTLGRLLESLKPPAGFSPNPRVGIPVDEFDCSRQLVHIFLFEFDYSMCVSVGEDSYVRWMDDHNLGVHSLADAHAVINGASRALASQRLTLNSGKTKILRPAGVVSHFGLDLNQEITRFEEKWGGLFSGWSNEAKDDFELRAIRWRERAADTGVEVKLLKRLYALSGKVQSDVLDRYVYHDLLNHPSMASRIFLSMVVRGKCDELVRLFKQYLINGHSLYDSVEAVFFESVLRLDVNRTQRLRLQHMSAQYALGTMEGQAIGGGGVSSALLAAHWFDADAKNLLEIFDEQMLLRLPAPAVRTWLTILRSRSKYAYNMALKKLAPIESGDVSRLIRYFDGLDRDSVKNSRIDISPSSAWPAGGRYIDMRKWLLLELYSNMSSTKTRRIAKTCLHRIKHHMRTIPEKKAFYRIWTNLLGY